MQVCFQVWIQLDGCRRVAFPIPHVPVTLRYRRPKPYAEAPKSLGQHLLRRRLTLSLTQPQAAIQLGTMPDTVLLWEKGRATPTVRYYPGIFRFLGYDPSTSPGLSLARLRGSPGTRKSFSTSLMRSVTRTPI